MRHDRLYLNDIVEAADHIADFIAGVDFDGFRKSEMLRIVQKLAVIGDAAAPCFRRPAEPPSRGALAADL
jgi:uncharacterized protein with HEPN domain